MAFLLLHNYTDFIFIFNNVFSDHIYYAPFSLRLIVIRSLRKKHFDRQHVGGRVSIIHPHATNSQWTILSNTEF